MAEIRRAMTGAATSWACSITGVWDNVFMTCPYIHLSWIYVCARNGNFGASFSGEVSLGLLLI